MVIADDKVNRDRFDELTGRMWKREFLETFRCGHCRKLFIGVPACHALLTDGRIPSRWRTYNRPQGTRCPECRSWIQGDGGRVYDVQDLSELQDTTWNWLLKAQENEGNATV